MRVQIKIKWHRNPRKQEYYESFHANHRKLKWERECLVGNRESSRRPDWYFHGNSKPVALGAQNVTLPSLETRLNLQAN